jgi:hypothetical protein
MKLYEEIDDVSGFEGICQDKQGMETQKIYHFLFIKSSLIFKFSKKKKKKFQKSNKKITIPRNLFLITFSLSNNRGRSLWIIICYGIVYIRGSCSYSGMKVKGNNHFPLLSRIYLMR